MMNGYDAGADDDGDGAAADDTVEHSSCDCQCGNKWLFQG